MFIESCRMCNFIMNKTLNDDEEVSHYSDICDKCFYKPFHNKYFQPERSKREDISNECEIKDSDCIAHINIEQDSEEYEWKTIGNIRFLSSKK